MYSDLKKDDLIKLAEKNHGLTLPSSVTKFVIIHILEVLDKKYPIVVKPPPIVKSKSPVPVPVPVIKPTIPKSTKAVLVASVDFMKQKSNEDIRDYETRYLAKYDKYVANHANIQNIDYVFIVMYLATDHIIERNLISDDMLFVYPGYREYAPKQPYIRDQAVHTMLNKPGLKNTILLGGVMMKADKSSKAKEYMDMMRNLNIYNFRSMKFVEWYTVSGKTVMVLFL